MFQLLAAAACLLGALMQLAVHRAPDIVDSRKSITMARRITVVALFLAAGYLVVGDPPSLTSLILGLLGMAQCMYAAHNLQLYLHGTHP